VTRTRFRSGWRNRVAEAVYEVVRELNEAGVYRFTVRQLFYQLVSRGVFQSTKQNYKNFDALLVRLRENDPWLDSMFIDTSKPRYDYYEESYWRGQEYFPEIWCVPPDTLVYTVDGLKPISEVRVGDYVLTHKGRFKRVTKVFKRWYRGRLVAIKIDGYHRPLRLTPEHKVLVVKTRRCIFKDGVICRPTCYRRDECTAKLYAEYRLGWMPASSINKGDIVVFPVLKETHSIKELKVGGRIIPLKHNIMRMLGFWVSEGSVGTRSVRWTFNVREVKYVGDVADVLSSLGIHVRIGKWSKNTRSVLATGKDFVDWLVESFGDKSFTKKLPSWALTLRRDLQIELLKGILYGDHSYENSRVSFVTSSQTLAHQIALLLIRLGYVPTMRRARKENHPLAKHDMFYVSVSGRQLYDFLFKFKLNISYNPKYSFNRAWNDGRYAYYVVRDVWAEEYEGYVYNLAVEDDESYVIEWMTVHNCEKDALRGFFEPYARRYKVNLVICRGYPSVTRLREAKEQRHVPSDVKYVILYFGDWDPSGEDIFRWINEELRPYNIEVHKIALTREQVKRYRLPPMVPKRSDPRYRKYVERYGEEAVELDALHPAVLRDIIRRSILRYMDLHKRIEVEVAEGIGLEAYKVVDEVLRDIRKKLEAVAAKKIREEINLVLPKVYQQLLEALERGEELSLSNLYDRERVLEAVRQELGGLM